MRRSLWGTQRLPVTCLSGPVSAGGAGLGWESASLQALPLPPVALLPGLLLAAWSWGGVLVTQRKQGQGSV